MKLSVIMPVYNEAATIEKIIAKVRSAPFDKEIIIVDDGSTDGTREYLRGLAQSSPSSGQSDIIVLFHDKNYGKGRAVRTGLARVSGDIVIIQDADLEYAPSDYHVLIEPILSGRADIVYGSRNLTGNPIGNRVYLAGVLFLSWLSNVLYGTRLTDIYTGYKAFRTEIIKSISLQYDRFEFCLEATAKLSRQGRKIIEVPVSYAPRSRKQGKKIRSWDGALAVWVLLKHRFVS